MTMTTPAPLSRRGPAALLLLGAVACRTSLPDFTLDECAELRGEAPVTCLLTAEKQAQRGLKAGGVTIAVTGPGDLKTLRVIPDPSPPWRAQAQALLSKPGDDTEEDLRRIEALLPAGPGTPPADQAVADGMRALLEGRRGRWPAARATLSRALAADRAAQLWTLEVKHLSAYLWAVFRDDAVSFAQAEALVKGLPPQTLALVPGARALLSFHLGQVAQGKRLPGEACRLFMEAEADARQVKFQPVLDLVPQLRTACLQLGEAGDPAAWTRARPKPGSCGEAGFLINYVYAAVTARGRGFLPGRSTPLAATAVPTGFPTPDKLVPTAKSLADVQAELHRRLSTGRCAVDARTTAEVALNDGWLACQEGRAFTLPEEASFGADPQGRLEHHELAACLARTSGAARTLAPGAAPEASDAYLKIIDSWETAAAKERARLSAWGARLARAEALASLGRGAEAARLLRGAAEDPVRDVLSLCMGEKGQDPKRSEHLACLTALRSLQTLRADQLALSLHLGGAQGDGPQAELWTELRRQRRRLAFLNQLAAALGGADGDRVLALAREALDQGSASAAEALAKLSEQGVAAAAPEKEQSADDGALTLECAPQGEEELCRARFAGAWIALPKLKRADFALREAVPGTGGAGATDQAPRREIPGARARLADRLLPPLAAALRKARVLRVLASGDLRDADLLGLPLPAALRGAVKPALATPMAHDEPRLYHLVPVEHSEDLYGPAPAPAPAGSLVVVTEEQLHPDEVQRLHPAEPIYYGVPRLGAAPLTWPTGPATARLVQKALPDHGELLYLGHIIVTPLGLMSGLVTREADTTVADLLRLSRAPRTAVLLGCEGGRSGANDVEGLSVEQAFLLRGSTAVLASLEKLPRAEGLEIFKRWRTTPELRDPGAPLSERLRRLRVLLGERGGHSLRVFVR